jgi:hypothetical protein
MCAGGAGGEALFYRQSERQVIGQLQEAHGEGGLCSAALGRCLRVVLMRTKDLRST